MPVPTPVATTTVDGTLTGDVRIAYDSSADALARGCAIAGDTTHSNDDTTKLMTTGQ